MFMELGGGRAHLLYRHHLSHIRHRIQGGPSRRSLAPLCRFIHYVIAETSPMKEINSHRHGLTGVG